MIAERKRADRRKAERFPVADSRVAYKRAGMFSFLNSSLNINNILMNMGWGGAQFVATEYIKPGTGLVLQVDVPAFVGGMCFKAETIWAKKLSGKKAYRIGVKFLKYDKETERRLHTLGKDVFFRTTKNAVGKPKKNKMMVG